MFREIMKAEFFFYYYHDSPQLKRNKFIFFLFRQIFKLYILKYIKNGKFLPFFL